MSSYAFSFPLTIESLTTRATTECLLDTGANVSCIPNTYIKQMQLTNMVTPNDAKIRGAVGNGRAVGCIVLTVVIPVVDKSSKDKSKKLYRRIIQFTVMDNDELPILIGFKDMLDMKAIIDYNTSIMSIQDDDTRLIIELNRRLPAIKPLNTTRNISQHEQAIIDRILNNLRAYPHEPKYKSIPLNAPAIAKLSDDARRLLEEEGFVSVDTHLVYCV